MSSKCKRPRLSTQTSIDSLPDEVMCMIFDRMYKYDVESASLTCHRWNNIIFRSNYASRFVLNIGLRNVDAVCKSERCYRNVKWAVSDQEVRSMWDTMHPKITNNLYSLEITCKNQLSTASTIALISESIPFMTELRSLAFIEDSRDTVDQDIPPTLLRSNSITRLKFISHCKVRVDMPDLQVFEGHLSALTIADESSQPPALDKLKELIISRNNTVLNTNQLQISIASAESILRRLTNIEKMAWNIPVEDAVFNAICESCTTLKELAFDDEMSYYNVVNVTKLNMLKHLRRLRIWRISFEPGKTCMDSVFDWSKLTHIEHIELGYWVYYALKLPKSVKKLEVCIDTDNEDSMIETITNSAAHLKELWVEIADPYGNDMDYDEPIQLLKTLPRLKHLEVLRFHHGRFLESSFLRMKAPLIHLHKLRIYDAQLQLSMPVRAFVKMSVSDFKFRGLKKKFPKLKEPEFSKCSLVPDPAIDTTDDDSCSSNSDEYYLYP